MFFFFFFFKKLLFHVWMSDHIIFWKSVDFKVRILFHHVGKSVVLWLWLSNNFFNSSWEGFIKVLLDLKLDFRLIINSVNFSLKFIVKSQMHQITMHVFFKHFCVNKILAPKLINFLFTNEFIFIIYDFFLLFLKFFSDVFNIRDPFRGGTKLRNKETSYFRVFKSCEDHTTVGNYGTHVNTILWLNTGKEVTLTVCNFYLFFVAENNVLVIIVQEMNWIDWLVIRRSQTQKFSVKSDIENWQCTSLTHTKQKTIGIAFYLTDCCWWIHFTNSLSLSEIPYLKFIATTEKYIKFFIKIHAVDKTVSV